MIFNHNLEKCSQLKQETTTTTNEQKVEIRKGMLWVWSVLWAALVTATKVHINPDATGRTFTGWGGGCVFFLPLIFVFADHFACNYFVEL